MQQNHLNQQKQVDDEKTAGNYNHESTTSIYRRYCSDLYLIGRIWISALQTVLTGSDIAIFPTIHAAKPEPTPKKPPPMRYKDLPLYTSPHHDYKDFEADKDKCCKYNVPILQEYLLPAVREYRTDMQKSYWQLKCSSHCAWKQLKFELAEHEKNFKAYMQDPDRLAMRQGVVVAGVVAGYYFTSKRGLPSRIFGSTLGGLIAGSLCFPKETDEIFREMMYRSAKVAIAVYNGCCRGDLALQERLTCKDEIPAIPPPRKSQCPKK